MKGRWGPLRPLMLATQFLTVVPVPETAQPEKEELGRSLLYYPVIGLLLGAILAVAAHLLTSLFTTGLSATLILALWLLLTGALHLDGFADSVDAWAGGLGSRERTLEIMKDPACGPMAVAALVLLLMIKLQALSTIITMGNDLFLLMVAPLLARTGVLALFLSTPYVRPQGLGEVLANHLPRRAALYLCLILPIALMFWIPSLALKLIFVNAVVFLLLRRMMIKRIGGCTGDTAGALVELLEVSSLLVVASHSV